MAEVMVEKTAVARWNGQLMDGNGDFDTGSGAIARQPVTWAARTGEPEGKTSPEEMIAAAHATCYAMAFAHALTEGGTPPEKLEVTASVGFGPNPEGGMRVTHSHLSVVGTVPGMDAAAFSQAATEAEKGCPVSNALRGNVEITVEAKLA